MHLLSLNGGGTCGYMTAKLLNKIEVELKTPIHQLFDITCGVSTGAIIAALVASGKSTEEIVDFYKSYAPKIFKKRSALLFWKPTYDIHILENLTDKFIPGTFGQPLKTRLMMYATKINNDLSPKFYKSWELEYKDIKISDAVVASCAAPTYFRPKKIGTDILIDGGMTSNNPSMCAIAEAMKLNAYLPSIYNLNINSGMGGGLKNAENIDSGLDWLTKIYYPLFFSNMRAVEYQAHQLIGFNNHVIKPRLNLPLDSLDFKKMDTLVDIMWNEHRIMLTQKLTLP